MARQHQSANVGEMVHALAQRVAAGELEPGPDGVDQLMGHVEQVWDRLEFRTPWAKARELERIRCGPGPVPRLAPRQHPHPGGDRGAVPRCPGPARTASRCRSAATPTASSSTPTAGSWSWTSRPVAPSRPTSRCSPTSSSGSTSSRSTTAPPTSSLDQEARAGGAELVHLGLTGDDEHATVQQQPDQADDGPERSALRARLARAAELLRSENFPAVAGQHCRDCDFVPICPIKSAGSVVGRRERPDAPPRHARRPRGGDGRLVGGQRAAVGRDHRAARARGRHRRRRVGQDHVDGGPRRLPRADRPGAARPGPRAHVHHQGGEPAARPDPRGADRRGCARRLRTRGRRRPRAHGLDLQRLRRRPAHRPRAADRARAGHAGHHRRRALPARCARGGPAHRRGRPPERPPQDRHPEPPRPRRPDERAPRRAPTTCAGSTARRSPGSWRPRRRSGRARTGRPTSERSTRPPTPSSGAASCSTWSRATAG